MVSTTPLADATNKRKSDSDSGDNSHEKKPRTLFSEEEKFTFEAAYEEDPFFAQDAKNRSALALTFNRTERQIKKWFQNRRAIEKREREEDEKEEKGEKTEE